jgi:hypothetical protein
MEEIDLFVIKIKEDPVVAKHHTGELGIVAVTEIAYVREMRC